MSTLAAGAGDAGFLFLAPFVLCSTVFLTTLLASACLYGILSNGMDIRQPVRMALLLGSGKIEPPGYGFLWLKSGSEEGT